MSTRTIGRPMEILLVEDSLLDARLTINALKKGTLQHRLTLILDGQEAMEFLMRQGRFAQAPLPDLILLDLLLPKLGGIEVLSQVKSQPELKDIPIVILTAAEDEDLRQEVESYGVEHFIRKPVNFHNFLQVVLELKNHWHQDLILPWPA